VTTLTVAADVSAAFSELHIVAVTVDGLDHSASSIEVEGEIVYAAVDAAASDLAELLAPHAKAVSVDRVVGSTA